MSYRDDSVALRAALADAEERLQGEVRAKASLGQKLERAESAPAAYRDAKHHSSPRVARGAWTAIAVSAVAWLSPVLATLSDHDVLASHLAVGAAAVALVSPFLVHAAAGSLLLGASGLVARLVLALALTSWGTVRSAAGTDSWQTLFWFGPLTLFVGALVECSLLIRQERGR